MIQCYALVPQLFPLKEEQERQKLNAFASSCGHTKQFKLYFKVCFKILQSSLHSCELSRRLPLNHHVQCQRLVSGMCIGTDLSNPPPAPLKSPEV